MILFAGDSFSFDDQEDCWTNIFANKMNKNFLNFSHGGSSLWYSYEKLTQLKIGESILKNKISHLIITCTNKDRIPFCESPEKSGLQVINFNKDDNLLDDNFANFVYFNKFYSIHFHNFVYKEILSRLITMYGKNTKIVLLSCFGDSVKFFKEIYNYNQDFLFCETPLMKFYKKDTENTRYKNHMSFEDNQKIANTLYEKINLSSSGSFKL